MNTTIASAKDNKVNDASPNIRNEPRVTNIMAIMLSPSISLIGDPTNININGTIMANTAEIYPKTLYIREKKSRNG